VSGDSSAINIHSGETTDTSNTFSFFVDGTVKGIKTSIEEATPRSWNTKGAAPGLHTLSATVKIPSTTPA
jgi:hypothetical protein